MEMDLPATPPFFVSHGERIDPEELASAWGLLRSVALRLDRIAKLEGWPTPFAPARYLILVQLERATAYGLTVGMLARSLTLRPSTLAHHLDVLERAGLVHRTPSTLHDRRKVVVRLTAAGRHAVQHFNRG
jgi:DNA-binding MarR family transcriptional regulator